MMQGYQRGLAFTASFQSSPLSATSAFHPGQSATPSPFTCIASTRWTSGTPSSQHAS